MSTHLADRAARRTENRRRACRRTTHGRAHVWPETRSANFSAACEFGNHSRHPVAGSFRVYPRTRAQGWTSKSPLTRRFPRRSNASLARDAYSIAASVASIVSLAHATRAVVPGSVSVLIVSVICFCGPGRTKIVGAGLLGQAGSRSAPHVRRGKRREVASQSRGTRKRRGSNCQAGVRSARVRAP